MPRTRTAKLGGPLRQEKWASSCAYDRGLMGHLVAKRVSVLPAGDPRRALIWFAQHVSWQPGGLSSLPVAGLEQWCLDPETDLDDAALRKLEKCRMDRIRSAAARYVQTSLGRRIKEALNYTWHARTVSITSGPSRIGKTFALRAYADQNPGLARYVQVPCSADEQSFVRAIAGSLGVPIGLKSKAVEIRTRVEEVLHSGDILLILDEAAYLFSQTWQRYSQPARVNWIMTALANHGVPVALVSCPHFFNAQLRTEKLTGWNSAQFIGRVGHIERLPDKLPASDLLAVARVIFPAGDKATLSTLAAYADVSQRHLSSIESIVKRARWLASKAGRSEATAADVQAALHECVSGDSALSVTLGSARRETAAELAPVRRAQPARTARGALATPFRDPFQAVSNRLTADAET